MVKLGEERINPRNIVRYYPKLHGDHESIIFKMVNGEDIVVPFENTERRDEMMKLLDDYLVSFDNGVVAAPDITDLPPIIFGGNLPGGMGGMEMH